MALAGPPPACPRDEAFATTCTQGIRAIGRASSLAHAARLSRVRPARSPRSPRFPLSPALPHLLNIKKIQFKHLRHQSMGLLIYLKTQKKIIQKFFKQVQVKFMVIQTCTLKLRGIGATLILLEADHVMMKARDALKHCFLIIGVNIKQRFAL